MRKNCCAVRMEWVKSEMIEHDYDLNLVMT